MTACVKNHSKRVALAISASLVGALSLGAAAPAFATGIDAQFVEGGSNEGAAEFVNGDVTFDFDTIKTDGSLSPATSAPDADGIETVQASSLPLIVSATEVKLAGTDQTVEVDPGNDFSIQVFRADEDGNPTGSPLAGNRVTDAGEYVIAITPLTGSDYLGQVFTERFNVAGIDLPTGMVAYEGENINDTQFIFTGSDLDVSIKGADGTTLKEGVDYDVEWVIGGNDVDAPKAVGTYTGKIVGKGKYAGSEGSVTVNVIPFGLGTATIVVNDFTGATPTSPASVTRTDVVNGETMTTELDPSYVTLTVTKGTDGTTTSVDGASSTNAVEFRADPSSAAGTSVNNSQTGITAYKVDRLATYTYNGAALQDSYDLDASKSEKFSTGDIKAFFGSDEQGKTVTVVKTGGALANPGHADWDLANGEIGEYQITIKTTPQTISGTVYGGSKTFTVRIWKGFIDCDTDLYCYGLDRTNKVAITSYAKGYDGEELTAAMFYIRNGSTSANLYNGELRATLYDADGNEVESAVDAGEYTLVVTSDTYKLTGSEGSNVLPITIGKVDLTTARIGQLLQWNDVAGDEYLPSATYATSTSTAAITSLGLVYSTGNAGDAYEDFDSPAELDDWKGEDMLPGYAVNVQVEVNDEGTWKPVAQVQPSDAGQYRVILSVSDDLASNFVLPEGENSVTLEFTVAAKKIFSDVQPSAWYYGSVNDAVLQGYVHGDSGSTTFRPEATITRGEVAVILYNMSGIDKSFMENETDSSYYEEGKGWKTGFDDVDGEAFYAKAIAWAKRAGVVNGYDGTNDFRPDAPVTSEEFAAMLSNYAEKVNQDDTVAEADPSSLEGVPGGSEVSGWAQKAVAWAVENEVMGNNGADIDAHGSIIRARVAAMCVNYQPNAKN